ncbi:MFS transporter [Synechococcus sp. RSCCF101]|nr:MFS transporter [Synechococcus sp. RSCCF101]
MALVRLVGSFGAGGVVYLTPLVFHQAAFQATEVGGGLAAAALAGTLGRFASGVVLDRGVPCSRPVIAAAGLAMAADALLWGAHSLGPFLLGQLLLGLAMGLYWPAIELAVPLCSGPSGSSRAFALVRSADALGIAAGTLTGALLARGEQLRGIYGVDLLCLTLMVVLLVRRPLPAGGSPGRQRSQRREWSWLPDLIPLLLISVVATAMPTLMQSALPLDLVRGGLQRPALPQQIGALLIGVQLSLLVVLQWPVGRWLARRSVARGLAISQLSFCVGSALLALSPLWRSGAALVLAAQLPIALGQASFLPVATEAVVQLTPPRHQGLAMALFSQCFALSALTAPLLAGWLLDSQGHGVAVWSLMALACTGCLPLVGLLDRRQRTLLIAALTEKEGEESRERVLYRLEAQSVSRPPSAPGSTPPGGSGTGSGAHRT